MNKTLQLFISHSCYYNDTQNKITGFLAKYGLNFTVSGLSPVHFKDGHNEEVANAIDASVKESRCIILLAGTKEVNPYWLEFEISSAKKYGKPIVVIEPWETSRTVSIIKENASRMVKWSGHLIAEAVKEMIN